MSEPDPDPQDDDRDRRSPRTFKTRERPCRGRARRRSRRSTQGRSSASSARTAPARPPRCACWRRCCTPTSGDATVAGADLPAPAGAVRRADRLRAAGRLDRSGRDRSRRARPPGAALRHGRSRREGACRRRPRRSSTSRPPPTGRLGTYSGGMKRRLDVGLGIVHRPAVLFLDEPTTGLDPQARARMWDEIRELREQRDDRLPDDPLPRGGRRAGRPPRDHRPRPDRCRGHVRRAEAPGRRRRRDDRRRRRAASTS